MIVFIVSLTSEFLAFWILSGFSFGSPCELEGAGQTTKFEIMHKLKVEILDKIWEW